MPRPAPDCRDPVDFYIDHAAQFDAVRSRTLCERSWLEALLADVPAGGAILDAGCGSGEPMAAYLLARGFTVTGVDAAPPLLELARQRYPQARWIKADLRSLDLGERFDAILAWDSLFHLSAQAQRIALATFRAHAAPGAALLFNSGGAHGESANPMFGEPLYHASLSPEEYRALLTAQGFHVVRHVAQDRTCGGRAVWLARREYEEELDD
ncbi:MAG TPA: class I SAM-dependent methyltransferase [Sphingobium sp.]|nr:class I SAM-dependent methyltransferase [Sphingobium sp.]